MSKKQPFFSIIITSYNEANRLAKTLDSLQAQTYTNFEILVIDSGSTDRTQELLYGYNFVHFVFHTESSRDRFANYNKGLQLVRGQYVTFLQAGDSLFSSQTLLYLKESLKSEGDVELFYGGALRYSGAGDPYYYFFPFESGYLSKGSLPTQLHSCWFHYDWIVSLGGFNEKYSYCSDYELLCRIMKFQDIRVVATKRVLIYSDYIEQRHKIRPRDIWEKAKILNRYYGIVAGLFWLLSFEKGYYLKIAWKKIKNSFGYQV